MGARATDERAQMSKVEDGKDDFACSIGLLLGLVMAGEDKLIVTVRFFLRGL